MQAKQNDWHNRGEITGVDFYVYKYFRKHFMSLN